MIEGDIRQIDVDQGEVELIHAGAAGIIAIFRGDGFEYSNGFPTEKFARSSFLSCVAQEMRRKAEELRSTAEKLDGMKLTEG